MCSRPLIRTRGGSGCGTPLARKDWSALDTLVTSADLQRQPAATLTFLSAALRANANYLLELEVLRQAQWKYPADYWINHRLGVDLIWRSRPNSSRKGLGICGRPSLFDRRTPVPS